MAATLPMCPPVHEKFRDKIMPKKPMIKTIQINCVKVLRNKVVSRVRDL